MYSRRLNLNINLTFSPIKEMEHLNLLFCQRFLIAKAIGHFSSGDGQPVTALADLLGQGNVEASVSVAVG
ncbi:MAG: hypothetical protein HPY74_16125 [Firmicutes bacterium]|nr:hypothetical protein [Bacillota bacterium]